MTKKEMWLKLFEQNDFALAMAIHLCERFGSEDYNKDYNKDFMQQRINELNTEIPESKVKDIF